MKTVNYASLSSDLNTICPDLLASESEMIEGRKYDENVVLSYFEIHVIVIAYTPVQLSSQTS